MNKKIFLTRSLRITTASLAVTFLSQGMLHAQMSTPATPVGAAQVSKVLASEEFLQGVRVDVLELKRTSGGTLTLKFAVANNTTENHSYDLLTLVANVSHISLLDLQNKKRHLVATDSAGRCVCSGFDGLTLKPGDRATFWAKFQAPPEQVTQMTIQMPGMPPFEDVPIAQ